MGHAELPLVSGEFDRDAATRMNDDQLDAAWAEPATLLLHLRDGLVPIRKNVDGVPELDLVSVTGERRSSHYFLGRAARTAVFAMITDEDLVAPTAPTEWQHPFQCGESLSAVQREMMTVALAVSNWHQMMPFSARDGASTVAVQGGWARHDAHGGEHFPRTDPAVIVLVEHESRLLLGSNVLWETGRFSLLAGFVEAGESAEQAVVREVFEEAGVQLDNVRYVASQPWPFPRSLMLGFRAGLKPGADPDRLVADPTEISELRWFTREELRHPQAGLKLPGRLSIARWLIDEWLEEGDIA